MRLPKLQEIDRLVALYLVGIALLVILIVETPFLIQQRFFGLSEEFVEFVILSVLLA
jgi:hypothetical protein